MKTIVNLSEYVEKLSEKDKKLFYRLYTLTEDVGRLKVPEEMKPWVVSHFGSVKAVESQKTIRVDNNITCESSLFNELRAKRPVDSKIDIESKKVIKKSKGGFFCNPLSGTAEDVFGRIKGKKSITCSNIAKYEALHGVVIFKEHNPLKLNKKYVKDYLKTANEWIKKAHELDPERRYPYILWNCLWKAGASIIHGHMQIVVAKKKPYGEIERLRRFAGGYKKVFKSDYFEDLFKIHKVLGLAFENKNNKIIAHLTPRKEKEVIILAKVLEDSSESIYDVLKAYLKMGVESFNIGMYLQPLDGSWNLPLIIRIVDRGKLSEKTADFGGMEVFAGTSVVSSDPYVVIERLKKLF